MRIWLLMMMFWVLGTSCMSTDEVFIVPLEDAKAPQMVSMQRAADALAVHVDREARWIVAQSLVQAKCTSDRQGREQKSSSVFKPAHSTLDTAVPTSRMSNRSKIDPNIASMRTLQRLPRVGKATAHAIVQGRPYGSVEDLLKVKGIGPKTLEGMRPMLQIGP